MVKSEFFDRFELRPLIRDRFMISVDTRVSRHDVRAEAFVVFNRFQRAARCTRLHKNPLCSLVITDRVSISPSIAGRSSGG